MKLGGRQLPVSGLHALGPRVDELPGGYREMVSDQEHEAVALEWCEGLIGDAIPQEGRGPAEWGG